MDWSIGEGYSGLYTNVNKRESAKQDLATLSVLSKELKDKRLQAEQDQVKLQAYNDAISKEADTLLAPDRAKVNSKAKEMSALVRQGVKSYGGDLGRFLENGGHTVLGEYKSSIVNSEEVSQMKDNKKNMERILDMQAKGFGHLMSSQDKFNLEQYQQNGGGKITFSGMLTELKMPNPNDYEYGEHIDPDKILYHEGNYTKVLANWHLENPDSDQAPTTDDLRAMVTRQHSDVFGTNWQKPLQERNQKYSEWKDQRDYDRDVEVEDREWELKNEEIKSKLEAERQAALAKQDLEDYGGGLASHDANGKEIPEEVRQQKATMVRSMGEFNGFLSHKIQSINNINSVVSDAGRSYFGASVLPDNNEVYQDFAKQGKGGEGNKFMLKGSKIIVSAQIADNSLKDSKLFPAPNPETGKFKIDLSKNKDMFDASGTNIGKWSYDSSMKPSTGILGLRPNYAQKLKDVEFSYGAISSAFIGKDKEGNDMIITDVADLKGNKATVDKSGNKKFATRNYDMKAKPIPTMVVTVIGSDGSVFYKKLDDDMSYSLIANALPNDLSQGQGMRKARYKEEERLEKKDRDRYNSVVGIMQTPHLTNNVRRQVINSTGANAVTSRKFESVAISFYTLQKAKNPDANLESVVQQQDFYKIVKEATSTPQDKEEFNALIKDPKTSVYQLTEFLAERALKDEDLRKDWLGSLDFVQGIDGTRSPTITEPKKKKNPRVRSLYSGTSGLPGSASFLK